jgi:hypothetical protein
VERCHSCDGRMHLHCADADCPNQCPATQVSARAWGRASRLESELKTLLGRIDRARRTGDTNWLYDYAEQVKGRLDG